MRMLRRLMALLCATSSCAFVAAFAQIDGLKGLFGKAILQNVPAKLNITSLRTSEGFAYRCEIKTTQYAIRASILWKILNTSGQLEETINSALLPSSTLDAGKTAICQALIDDGVFFKLVERALPRRKQDTHFGFLAKKTYPPVAFPFLTERSKLTLEEFGGQKYARCSTGQRIILSGQVQWKFDNKEALTTEKNTILLTGRPSATISCKYSALLWSDDKEWSFNYFENVPSLVAVTEQEDTGFVEVQFPDLEALGLDPSETPQKREKGLKCLTHSTDWGCEVLPLQDAKHQLVSYFKKVKNPSHAELTLEVQVGKEKASQQISLRTKSSAARQFKKTALKIEKDQNLQAALRCSPSSAIELGSDLEQRQKPTYFWIAERNRIISYGPKPYLETSQISKTVKRVRCGMISSTKENISFGISDELSLMQGFHQISKNNWLIIQNENNSKKLQFEALTPNALSAPFSRKVAAADSKQLVCFLRSSKVGVFPKNLCESSARLISGNGNPIYEVELTINEADTLAALSAAALSSKDRLIPRELEIVVAEAAQQPVFGIFKLQVLKINHAPKILHHVFTSSKAKVDLASSDAVAQSRNLCEVRIQDPDNDHMVGSMSFQKENIFQNLFSTFAGGSVEVLKSKGKNEFKATAVDPSGVMNQDCFVTLSDGVLISKSRAVLGKAAASDVSQKTSAAQTSEKETSPQFPLEKPSLNSETSLEWLGNSQEVQIHFNPFTIQSFGMEPFEVASDEQTPVVNFCLAERGSCPVHSVSKGKLIIAKTSSLVPGIYIFATATSRRVQEFLVFDVFNDGYTFDANNSLKTSRNTCQTQENHKAAKNEFCFGDNIEKMKTKDTARVIQYQFPRYDVILPNSEAQRSNSLFEKIAWEALLSEKLDSFYRVTWKKPVVCSSDPCAQASEVRIQGSDASGQKYLVTIPLNLVQEDSGKKQYLSQMYHEAGTAQTPGRYVCEVSRFEEGPNEKPFKVLLLSLGKVIRSQENFDHKTVFQEDPGKELFADSCEFYLGSELIAQSVVKPSMRAELVCAVTTRDGWTSSVPCNFTGNDSAQALEMSHINLYSSNLVAQPEFVRAAWISNADQVEKGIVHRFTAPSKGLLAQNSAQYTQATQVTQGASAQNKSTFQEHLGEDLSFTQEFASDHAERFQVEYFSSEYALPKAIAKLHVSLLESPAQSNVTLYCRFPSTKAEMCEALKAVVKSKLTKPLTAKGSTFEMKQENVDGPFLVLEATVQNSAASGAGVKDSAQTAVQIFRIEKTLDLRDALTPSTPSSHEQEKPIQKLSREAKPQ